MHEFKNAADLKSPFDLLCMQITESEGYVEVDTAANRRRKLGKKRYTWQATLRRFKPSSAVRAGVSTGPLRQGNPRPRCYPYKNRYVTVRRPHARQLE